MVPERWAVIAIKREGERGERARERERERDEEREREREEGEEREWSSEKWSHRGVDIE